MIRGVKTKVRKTLGPRGHLQVGCDVVQRHAHLPVAHMGLEGKRDAGSTAVLIGRLLFSLCSVVIGLFLRRCGSANEITHAGNGECQEPTFWRICQPGIDDAFSDPYDIRRPAVPVVPRSPPSCTRFFRARPWPSCIPVPVGGPVASVIRIGRCPVMPALWVRP